MTAGIQQQVHPSVGPSADTVVATGLQLDLADIMYTLVFTLPATKQGLVGVIGMLDDPCLIVIGRPAIDSRAGTGGAFASV